jgi:hypothetical protein
MSKQSLRKVLISFISRGMSLRGPAAIWLVEAFNDQVDPSAQVVGIDLCSAEPTSRARNMAVKRARKEVSLTARDILIMVDDDIHPSMGWYNRATRFLEDYPGPTCFASPYRGAPPERRVEVQHIDGHRFTQEEAANKKDIEQVAAIGTGLIAFNMACFDQVEKANLLPWFEYDYSDPPYNTDVSQTEDYHFLHNLILAGGRVFCDWESWSGHAKVEIVGKPELPLMRPLPLKNKKGESHVG